MNHHKEKRIKNKKVNKIKKININEREANFDKFEEISKDWIDFAKTEKSEDIK